MRTASPNHATPALSGYPASSGHPERRAHRCATTAAWLAAATLACGLLASCATAPPVERTVPVTAENLPEVQRAGYTVVNRDGQKLYCRRERRTGSHARFETSCLTAEELESLKDSTQRGLEAMRRTRPPPQDGG